MTMSIDKSRDWWTSPDAADIQPFLRDLAKEEGTMPINAFRLAKCACGSLKFRLTGDEEEGCARRICAACTASAFICDSEDYWSEATPEALVCHGCDADVFNVGVGFSWTSKAGTDVGWIIVGQRCVHCGILGSFVDWKVSHSPSLQLLGQV
jgi:hypothetical protein